MTYFFGILAYPASHSLSPQMHNAALLEKKINAAYTRYEISPANLETFISKLRKENKIKGLSVSVPHKENIIPMLDSIDESVEQIGAVNTVYSDTKNNKLIGTNTDYIGFRDSLLEKYNPKEKNILVLGAGGATRAIIYALRKLGVKEIFIWNRTKEKAKGIADLFDVTLIDSPEEIAEKTDLVINTTSLGMKGDLEKLSPVSKNFWKNHHTAYDIVYTPLETKFLQDAKNAGGKSISGEKMLLFQGAEQFKIFTGKNPNLQEMERALKMKAFEFKNWEKPILNAEEKINILETIVERKKKFLFQSQEFIGKDIPKANFEFYNALKTEKGSPHLIAEIKPASPSKGQILEKNESVKDIAKLYEKNRVSCISVLTDQEFFGADINNLQKVKSVTNIPLLRKDFITDPSQIYEARAFGASAILLMRSVLSSKRIEELLNITKNLGMDVLVETHDQEELFDVLSNTSARIIGVNTRDLKTLQINPENFLALQQKAKEKFPEKFSDIIWVCESGISSKENVKKYASNANAVLVGTGILLAENREEKIKELVGTEE